MGGKGDETMLRSQTSASDPAVLPLRFTVVEENSLRSLLAPGEGWRRRRAMLSMLVVVWKLGGGVIVSRRKICKIIIP